MVYPEFIYLFINLFHANARIYFTVFPALCNKQKQLPEVFCKKLFLKSFALFTGKYLCWSLSLINLWHLQLYQKETPVQVFSCEFCETFNNTYFRNICERLLLNKCYWVLNVQSPEVFSKNMFLKTLQYWQENTCVRVTFLVKLLAWDL